MATSNTVRCKPGSELHLITIVQDEVTKILPFDRLRAGFGPQNDDGGKILGLATPASQPVYQASI
jgi:hypothetical protein